MLGPGNGASGGLYDWLSPNHNLTNDGAGLISSWAGRKGAVTVTAATTARPTWAANSFNSAHAGLTFDGVANTMASTTLTGLPTSSTSGEIWAVFGPFTNIATQFVCRYGATTAGAYRSLGSTASAAANITEGLTACSVASPLLTAGFNIVRGQWSGTTESIWLNGVAGASNPVTIASLNTGTTRIRIGAGNATSAANFAATVVSDVFITGILNTLDANRMLGWIVANRGFV